MDTIVLKLKDAVDNPNLKRIGELSYKWKGSVNTRPIIGATGSAIWIDGSIVNSLSNVDWTVDHVISITKDYLLTLYIDNATFCDFDLSELSHCNDIVNLHFADFYSVSHRELGTITGDISSLANLDKLETLELIYGGRIRGNLESLSNNASLGKIEIHSSLIEGDVAKLPSTTYSLGLTGSGSPYFLAYERIPVTYSSPSLRADSSNKSITVGGAVFASSDDVNNYLIATSNCAFAGNTSKKISITCKGTFTPSEDALAAIQNLKTNMYSAVGDSERTVGTYYTSIKVNNTDY